MLEWSNWSIFSTFWSLAAIAFALLTLHTLVLPPSRRIALLCQLSSYGKTSITFPGYPKLLGHFVNLKVDKGRHFKRFYAFAMVNFVTFYFLIYIQDSRTCARIINFFLTPQVTGNNVNLEGGKSVRHLMLTLMLLLQLTRRLYECHFVAVANAKGSFMHVSHLALGYLFYFNVTLLVIHSGLHLEDVSPVLATLGMALFGLGSWIQHSSHVTLANVRLAGRTVGAGEYQLPPREGFFTLVSCPNYLGEIVIYVAFALVSSFDCNFVSLLAFVSALHSQAALASHEWYKSQFSSSKNLPDNRKALIPFLF